MTSTGICFISAVASVHGLCSCSLLAAPYSVVLYLNVEFVFH
jgi:hypothetical protein